MRESSSRKRLFFGFSGRVSPANSRHLFSNNLGIHGFGVLAGFLVNACLGLAAAQAEDSPSLHIATAWVAPVDKTGGDIALALTIVNDAAEADALLRVSCPFANFAEKHTVDRGEGAPSMRVIRALPIPAKATTELNGEGEHVMLLQVRQKLATGEKLSCSITFQKAGKLKSKAF